jgi:citronellol/citronellal dehydrogenase
MAEERDAATSAQDTLHGKTLFITGASRGIGKEIGLRAARDGANVVVAARTNRRHPKLPGTIHTAAEEIERAGGRVLACRMDVRSESEVHSAVEQAVTTFGGIDVLVNNASAIFLGGIGETPMKRFDLMNAVNVRGTFLCTKACLPHLRVSGSPHVLVLAPPLDMRPEWFAPHLAYTISKFGMGMCVLGLAEELKPEGIAVNALWPRTTIATAAVRNLLGGEKAIRRSRKPAIVADAAHYILTRNSRRCTGNFFLDEEALRAAGTTDFRSYSVDPTCEPDRDLFV